jgi:hypothetical protein
VRWFADMLTHLRGERLATWIAAAEQAALPAVTKFVAGLTADLAVVTADLSLPFSSGPVEGNVNRLNSVKSKLVYLCRVEQFVRPRSLSGSVGDDEAAGSFELLPRLL